MLPVRFPWVWWTCGWLLVAGVCIGSLLPAAVIEEVSIQDKILHMGAYGVMMLWFAGLYRRQRHWIIAVLLFGLGLMLDLLQGASVTRTFDIADVTANSGGILLALVLSMLIFEGWCLRIEQWLFPRK